MKGFLSSFISSSSSFRLLEIQNQQVDGDRSKENRWIGGSHPLLRANSVSGCTGTDSGTDCFAGTECNYGIAYVGTYCLLSTMF